MSRGVAAHVAGWQLRLGGQAGPLGPVSAGSGDSPNGTPLQVEILLDGIWTDITSRVMTRDGSFKVRVTRGQPNETSQTVPGTCGFQLNNRDGLFSPRNPVSPYYGKIGRNTQLRVSVPSGNDKSYRFSGEVAQWPSKWDGTGTDVWVELEAAGPLRRLGQGNSPVSSALYTAMAENTGSNPPIVYWPCEDSVGSTSIASAVSAGSPMTIAGTPTLASFSSFACSKPLPLMAHASFTGTVPSYTAPSSIELDFLLAVPTGGEANGTVLCRATATGTIPVWEVYYSTGGGGISFLGLRGKNMAGTVVQDTGPSASSNTGTMDGALTQVRVVLAQSGADLTYTVYIHDVADIAEGTASGTATNSTAGQLTSVSIAPNRDVVGSAIGHVSLAPTFDLYYVRFDVLRAYTGEAAATRISRLCSSNGTAYGQIGTASDTVAMGSQATNTLLGLLQDCATADAGILYESTSALGLGYRTRVSLENQAAALALSYTGINLAGELVPLDDDQYTRNDITVSRQGGSSARQTLKVGALSVQPPPAGVGPYPDAVTVNVQADSTLADQAGWRLHLSTVDEARYPTVSVNLAHPSYVANPTLRQQVLALRPGDRLTISNPPAWLPPDLISQLVIGWTETIDHFEHRLTFNCVPESPYHTAVLEDAVLGRLDTGGSQLAADALPTDTTLLVATTTGPLWTTTDTPFDVRISGEQITVTGVTGAVSPQTFTCTRSVNGVVKPLAVGADVRLNQPMILAL